MLPDLRDFDNKEIVSIFTDINQSRSAFQIEKFVLGQHDTEEMKYYQCVLELQQLYHTIKKTGLSIKKIEIEIDRLRKTGDEIDMIESQIKEIDLEQIKSIAVGALKEYAILMDLYQKFPKYSREDIEKKQPEYWERRLVRQYELAGNTSSANQAAHLDSLIQIGKVSFKMIENDSEIEKKEIVDNFDNKIKIEL